METDGRIRSKNIGTGEINSRTLDNIRSSNFDGSHDDPENNPGSEGWQILKSGFVVINEAIVRGTLQAAKIISAVLESGSLNIRSGGSLTVGGDPETGVGALLTLDESGVEIGPTSLTSSGVVIGPTSLTSSGVTVGTDVEIDATGLQVIGGYVTPLWPFRLGGGASNVSLTTTATDFVTVTANPPAWVEKLVVMSICRFQMSASATHNLRGGVTNDDGGASSQRVSADSTTHNGETVAFSVPNSDEIPLSPAGRSVNFVADASVNSGTNSVNSISLSVFGYGVRN